MGTKSPSDLSPSSVGEVSRVQLRSQGPVQQCSTCKRDLAMCLCATPSTSSGVTLRRTKPKKRPQPLDEPAESSVPRRQLFRDNIETVREGARARHTCPHCPKSFGSPGKLGQHLFSHTGERPFVCQHCSKAFSSRFKLVRHALIHSDQRQYRCLSCDRTFHRKDHLKNHSKVHSLVKRRYKCDREGCGKEYSSPLSYRKHVALHAAEDGNLECTICGETYASKEEIVTHLKIHAGSRAVKTQADRKYRCDHCDRSFFTGKDVRRHLVVHTGKRDFLCQFCPQRFGRKDHLVRHIKKSHNHVGKKGKKKPEPKTKSVAAILEEASTSKAQSQTIVNEMKNESSLSIFSVKDDDDCSSKSSKIFKVDTEELVVPFSQSDNMDIMSETSGSMMSDNVYQSPPPSYPVSVLSSSMTFDPGTSPEELEDIKPEMMSTDFITLIPHPFQTTALPPNLLLTTSNSPELSVMPVSEYLETEEEPSLHRQFLQMSNYITPQTNQSSSSTTELIISDFIQTSEAPTSSTPLPRFNQAFNQQPP